MPDFVIARSIGGRPRHGRRELSRWSRGRAIGWAEGLPSAACKATISHGKPKGSSHTIRKGWSSPRWLVAHVKTRSPRPTRRFDERASVRRDGNPPKVAAGARRPFGLMTVPSRRPTIQSASFAQLAKCRLVAKPRRSALWQGRDCGQARLRPSCVGSDRHRHPTALGESPHPRWATRIFSLIRLARRSRGKMDAMSETDQSAICADSANSLPFEGRQIFEGRLASLRVTFLPSNARATVGQPRREAYCSKPIEPPSAAPSPARELGCRHFRFFPVVQTDIGQTSIGEASQWPLLPMVFRTRFEAWPERHRPCHW
jgi:hypothetical protein